MAKTRNHQVTMKFPSKPGEEILVIHEWENVLPGYHLWAYKSMVEAVTQANKLKRRWGIVPIPEEVKHD